MLGLEPRGTPCVLHPPKKSHPPPDGRRSLNSWGDPWQKTTHQQQQPAASPLLTSLLLLPLPTPPCSSSWDRLGNIHEAS